MLRGRPDRDTSWPGQLFGDQATLNGQRDALTAHSVASTVLLAVRRQAMRNLLLPRGPPAQLTSERAGAQFTLSQRTLHPPQPLFGSEWHSTDRDNRHSLESGARGYASGT